MAVTILNEINVAGQNDDLLSPFNRPCLYFKVTGAGAVTTPEAEIEIAGAVETLQFDCTFLRTVSSEHYFHLDLSEIMKYLLRYFDSDDKPDDLDFQSAEGITLFDYFRNVDIDIYFERGTGDEQTLTVTKDWIYLANQIPYVYGFNLVNVSNNAQLSGVKFKWSKDTYNAFFFWHPGGEIEAGVSGLDFIFPFTGWTNSSFTTFTSSGINITSAIKASGSGIALTGGIDVYTGRPVCFVIDLTVNSGAATYKTYLTDGSLQSNEVTLVAGRNYVRLVPTTTDTVNVAIESTGGTNFSAVVNPKGYYQFKFSKSTTILSEGNNSLSLTTPNGSASFSINYQPNCTFVNLCWQHSLLGYVSYPIEGVMTELMSFKEGDSINKFLTTLASVNTLKEQLGYDAEKKITVLGKVGSDYFDQLQEIHGSRHVYLFIGAAGAADSALTWVECKPAGNSSVRPSRAKEIFAIELTLPEYFNIKL